MRGCLWISCLKTRPDLVHRYKEEGADMKNRFYNFSRMYYIVLVLRGQLSPQVIVAPGSAAIVGMTGLLAALPLIR